MLFTAQAFFFKKAEITCTVFGQWQMSFRRAKFLAFFKHFTAKIARTRL
jgi:hypothetical protein